MPVLLIIFSNVCFLKHFSSVVFVMLTNHKNGAMSMSAWRRDATLLECCQVNVILTSPLSVSQLKMCVWESERQRVECTCSCKYLHRESKSRATVMSQYKCWAKIRHQIKQQPMNHFSKCLPRKIHLEDYFFWMQEILWSMSMH